MKPIITTLIALATITSLFAQVDRPDISPELKEELEARKVAFITNQLDLSPDEAQTFWPIYNQHEKSMEALRKKYPRPRKEEVNMMSDDEATQLIANFLSMEEEQLAEKKKFYRQLDGVISDRKIAMLIGVEGAFKRRLLRAMKDRRHPGQRDKRGKREKR